MSEEMEAEDDSSNNSIESVILAIKNYYPNAQVNIVDSNKNNSFVIDNVINSSPTSNKSVEQNHNDGCLGLDLLAESNISSPEIIMPSCSTEGGKCTPPTFSIEENVASSHNLDKPSTFSKDFPNDGVNLDETDLILLSDTPELDISELNTVGLDMSYNTLLDSDHCYTPLINHPSHQEEADNLVGPDWVPFSDTPEVEISDLNVQCIPSGSTNEIRAISVQSDHCYTSLKPLQSQCLEEDDPDDPTWVPTSPKTPEQQITDPNVTEQNISLGTLKKERKRKIHSDKSEWKDIKNKKLRETGKSYTGWSRPKNSKGKRGAERGGRKIGPPCISEVCRKSQQRECQDINQNESEELFDYFWKNLNWDQKKVYIVSLVTKKEKIETKKKAGEESRRNSTYIYTIKKPNGQIIRVCKCMFLNTFGLGEWAVLHWVSTSEKHGMLCSKEIKKTTRNDTRSHQSEGKIVVQHFLDTLPKLPSHYSRQNTKKVYVEPTGVSNMSDIYNEYKRLCENKVGGPVKPLSRFTFDMVIDEKNISFQPPKKDRCDLCISYEEKQLSEEEYRQHIARKEAARTEKNNDKSLGENGKCIVLTQDLQSVKVCPSLNASALYYKTKLLCHNFTILDQNTKKARCFWFDESQSDLTANTYANCVIDFLKDVCVDNKSVIIWSDGCTAQNRNAIFSNALLSFSHEKQIEITQKFLEKGHTQMEVDSVHATIERKLKNKPIHLPSDYLRYTTEARKNKEYETKSLSFDFFKDFSKKGLMVFDSIRPGRKPGDPTVMDIKAIRYLPGGVIQTKLSFEEDFVDIPQRRNLAVPPNLSSFPQLHPSSLKITKTKWQHLQDLKFVLPTDCHAFYDSLKYDEDLSKSKTPKCQTKNQPKLKSNMLQFKNSM